MSIPFENIDSLDINLRELRVRLRRAAALKKYEGGEREEEHRENGRIDGQSSHSACKVFMR